MKKFLLTSILFPLLYSTGLFGQSNFGMSKVVTGFTDTVPMFYTDSFNVWVKNYGTNSFWGDIALEIAVDTGNGVVNVFKSDTTLYTTSNFQMNDSLLVTVFYTYTPTNFQPGGNTIVIWPMRVSGTTATTLDSLFKPVFIQGGVGMPEPKGYQFRLYPNPAKDELRLHFPDPEAVRELRLYDVLGSLVRSYPYQDRIGLEERPAGVYFLEAVFTDGRRNLQKVVKL